MWGALTAVAALAIAAAVVLVGGIIVKGIAFLSPILLPVAVAWVLTYLLNPVVGFFQKKMARIWAVICVFVVLLISILGVGGWVGPILWKQASGFGAKMPDYLDKSHALFNKTVDSIQKASTLPFLKSKIKEEEDDINVVSDWIQGTIAEIVKSLQQEVPKLAGSAGNYVTAGIGGVVASLRTLLSLALVPIFLFFFLYESPNIVAGWEKYLPLHASAFKNEVVELVTEINRYLICFFRGQLLVSMIDGLITGIALLCVGMEFALFIGLMIGVFALIPYIGIILCWIPAVIIATAQSNSWQYPLLVTLIFMGVNYLEGIFISPKIVGNSVGLHPLTVILSVLAWSVIFGGILGAILAVPLTATFKVLLKRYFWDEMSSPALNNNPENPGQPTAHTSV